MRRACIQDRSARGFSWCGRHVSGRSPVRAPPFSAAGRAMRLDRCGIDRQGHTVLAAISQRVEDRLPTPTLRPAIEAIVDGRVRTIFGWAIAPACTRLEHMHDAADDASIVVARRPGEICRQVRRYPRPLPVAQPKQSFSHRTSPVPNRSERENQCSLIRYRP
jgi:hypothetical protein